MRLVISSIVVLVCMVVSGFSAPTSVPRSLQEGDVELVARSRYNFKSGGSALVEPDRDSLIAAKKKEGLANSLGIVIKRAEMRLVISSIVVLVWLAASGFSAPTSVPTSLQEDDVQLGDEIRPGHDRSRYNFDRCTTSLAEPDREFLIAAMKKEGLVPRCGRILPL
ncbi:hypothetical protein GALMADRAFT_145929 [Galerina marginata CBS 339.88]|uniref:Uncharacterized protein n=1 Tax=Galerina marginata (strain CBS 339.88) TaxID=685588 RepID=A0A067SMI4_GALM3|nr:hypothetical protein GALMADRAFT_145929 [Galerina marginata CBS 339.88]